MGYEPGGAVSPSRPIVAMSSSRVFLGELLSSRARLRFLGWVQVLPPKPRSLEAICSEWQPGTFVTVSTQGVIPKILGDPVENSA